MHGLHHGGTKISKWNRCQGSTSVYGGACKMNTHFNGAETLMPEGVAGASGTRMPSHPVPGSAGVSASIL